MTIKRSGGLRFDLKKQARYKTAVVVAESNLRSLLTH
jgi:hypothetical protein